MSTLDHTDRWLKSPVKGAPDGVDRQAGMLRGYVVAQLGPFKSDGRGEFDRAALETIVKLGNAAPAGLKSRFMHPTVSDDGLGKFLGRSRDFRLGQALDARTGKAVSAVRADLKFDSTALDTPPQGGKPLGKYIMDLAESDPGALSSSLVLKADDEYRRKKDGTLELDDRGEPLPPLWRPTELHASDIVDTGDAVDALLSPEELCRALSVGVTPELSKVLRFDNVARLGAQLLDGLFAKLDRAEIEARCRSWLARYLAHRFEQETPPATPKIDARAQRLTRLAEKCK